MVVNITKVGPEESLREKVGFGKSEGGMDGNDSLFQECFKQILVDR